MIPIKYNLRSIWARKVGSLMTIVSTGIAVGASVFALGLSAGLDQTLEVSAGPLDIIVLRQGSSSETASGVSEAVAREILALPGIATDQQGRPLAAPELVVVTYLPRRGNAGSANVTIRGALPVSRDLREGMKVVEGRDFHPGLREAIVSRKLAGRFEGLGMNEEFVVQDKSFKVVGLFEAGGGATESEIWTDQKVLAQVANRTGGTSSVQIRAASKADQETLLNHIKADEQIALKAITEVQYFADQAQAGLVLRLLGQIIAFFLTIGAMFAVANTMYGAIATRAREIGTLRSLGFGRGSILTAFLLESLVLCLVGAIVGCLASIALTKLFGGQSAGTMNGVTFTEIVFAFSFGPNVLIKGALLAVFLGVVGGFLPALRAVRMKVVDALREV
ncbi:MAG: ABC transporter permease [Planctomycetia bacterium]|nr:ABC transporter permease [Planctomycetia bacterium]